MSYLRKFADYPSEPDKFQPSFIGSIEGCGLVKNSIPAGTSPEPMHKHWFDLCYFVLDGALTVHFGHEEHLVPANTLIRIPAGVPHMAFNGGATELVQVSLMMPAYVPVKAGNRMSLYDLCEPEDGPVPPADCIRTITDDGWTSGPGPDYQVQILADRASGSQTGYLAAVRREPGTVESGYTVHEFDKLMFVLEGALGADLAGAEVIAGPRDTVLVPAGVPHRVWNAGPLPEIDLTVITPEPATPGPWSRPVTFAFEV
jgi:mannose-6-phosphate isomerase-like protein (cupin superfamily)